MEDFIYELPEGRSQDILEQAIRGKGVFRRFKDCLYNLGLEKNWHIYRDAAYEEIAREWCVRYGIVVEE